MDAKFDDMKGRAKKAAGDLTDDEGLEREGKVDQGQAAVKEKLEAAGDKLRDIVNRD